MLDINLLKKIQGKQTADTIAEILGLNRQSAINLASKIKKEGYMAVSGGGHQPRIYTISLKKVAVKKNGMFDILNKYSKEKIIPPFIHEPHGKYSIEKAIVDLIETNDLRILVNSLALFNHIKNWPELYAYAKKKSSRRKIGALYDIARTIIKVRNMPKKTRELMIKSDDNSNFLSSSKDFSEIEKNWVVKIPFNKKDIEVYK